jgi:E3 ubiquitin-protein ligase RAD18
MLKEGALRKKLQEIGIPHWGSKDLMRRRHVEWLNIYNSNCDADDSARKSKRQLLKELEEWEQTQGGRADTKESKIMKKDFDGEGYAKSHKSDFDDLIAQARQKRSTPKADGEDAAKQSNTADGQHQSSRDAYTNPAVGTDHTSQKPSSNEDPSNTHPAPFNIHNPYENNESALASIRAKVEEANSTSLKVPNLSPETSMESARRRSSEHSEGMQNPFGNPSKKVPMFALPEEPVKDIEGSTAVQ